MAPIVVTSCSSRKRCPTAEALRAADLPRAGLLEVASEWRGRVAAAQHLVPADELYAGRSFKEATLAAAGGSELYVVSAGLGLLHSRTPVSPYSLTVSAGSSDNVLSRIVGAATPAEWWEEGPSKSLFSQSFKNVVGSQSDQLVLLALPTTYLQMVTPELLTLSPEMRVRLRLFTMGSVSQFPTVLQPQIMPYNARLDAAQSVYRGTRTDFAQRALHHFTMQVLRQRERASAAEHRTAVEEALTGLGEPPSPVRRERRDDADLRALIEANWEVAKGKAGAMLRVLRDDLGIACEQGRLARLFNDVAADQARVIGTMP